jgi:diguanylate cyclase (GGDEF)-like protein
MCARPRRDPAAARKPREGADKPPGDNTVALPSGAVRAVSLDKQHPGLVVIQGVEIGREYRLRKSRLVLGRAEDAAIRIPDEMVSRHHAEIEVRWVPASRACRVILTDLESTNHTYVNGGRIRQAELKEGDKVRIGDTVLKFVVHDDLDARFHEEIRNRIAYDQLTGLLTKESLVVALDAELRRCLRYGLPMAVLMMDLDHFKRVNDTRGHLMGSHVLTEVGLRVREAIRSTDVAARYGGEEFLAYLAEATAAQAGGVAERIRAAIEAAPFVRSDETGRTESIRVTISIGVAQSPIHGSTVESLIAAADAALYRAKGEGRNRVCLA